MPLRLTAADVLLAAVLAASALWWWMPGRADGPVAAARVTAGGEEAVTVRLDRPGTGRYHGPLGETVVEFGRGRARIVSSPCPNQTCVAAGWRDVPGGAVVCLPNRVAVVLDGLPAGIDAVSR